MSKHLLIILFVFLNSVLYAQYEKIDSLKNMLTEHSLDSLKVDIYMQVSKEYRLIDLSLDTSFLYNDLAFDIAQKNGMVGKQAHVFIRNGQLYRNQGDHTKAKENFAKALVLSKSARDTFLIAASYNSSGLAYLNVGQYDEAFVKFEKCLEYATRINHEKLIESASNNIGCVKADLGQAEEAIKYFKKAAFLANKNNIHNKEGLYIMNIGDCYLNLGKLDLALLEFEKVTNLISIQEDPYTLALNYSNIGNTLSQMKKHEEALENAERSLSICKQYNVNRAIAEAFFGKSIALIGLENYSEAISNAEQGIAITQTSGAVNKLPRFYNILSKSYEGQGDLSNALAWERNYSALNDSLNKLDINQKVAQLEIRYQSKEKEAENALLKEEKKIQSLIIDQRTRIAIISAIILLLLIVIITQMYLARNKSKLMNKQLEAKVKMRTVELEILNNHLIQSNEELERFAFIASHDLKEPLRNIGGFISLMKKRILAKDYGSLEEYIGFVEKGNKQMYNLVETILEYSKMEFKQNSKLELIDLKKEVQEVCDLLRTSLDEANAKVHIDDLPKINYFPTAIKVVVKNLIENGIKYNESEVPTIHISNRMSKDKLSLVFTDNGIGVSPEYHHKIFDMFVRLNNRNEYNGSGMGLAFCKKILINNGGSIRIESEENKGSTFIIDLPLDVLKFQEEKLTKHANKQTTNHHQVF